MRIFIVHAHPEPNSFNGALTRAAEQALAAAGHEVVISDLYAMGFNPVSDRRNFTTVLDAHYCRQQAEEANAAVHGGFAPDIQAEMDKLFWCDALILQFPLWWFGLPAILKGSDRVFTSGGRIYGGGKWYDRGVFSGKRAMCSVTIGGPPPIYSDRGLNGPIDSILFSDQPRYALLCRLHCHRAFLVHAPARIGDGERKLFLSRYREQVLSIARARTVDYPKLADFDATRVLKYRFRFSKTERPLISVLNWRVSSPTPVGRNGGRGGRACRAHPAIARLDTTPLSIDCKALY